MVPTEKRVCFALNGSCGLGGGGGGGESDKKMMKGCVVDEGVCVVDGDVCC